MNEEMKTTEIGESPLPPAGDVEVLAVVTLGSFSAEELGDIDIEPRMVALESLQQEMVKNEDVYIELVDRAHITRLQETHQGELAGAQAMLETACAERDALQAEVVGLEEAMRIKASFYDQECEAHKRTQSELTKARECIANALGLLRADKPSHAQCAILRYQGFPSDHRSAPAAKGGE